MSKITGTVAKKKLPNVINLTLDRTKTTVNNKEIKQLKEINDEKEESDDAEKKM